MHTNTNTNTNILLIQTSSQIISNVIWSWYHQIVIWSYGPYLHFRQLLTYVTIALFGVYRHDLAWVFVQTWPWWCWWIHASFKSFPSYKKSPSQKPKYFLFKDSVGFAHYAFVQARTHTSLRGLYFQFLIELRLSWGPRLELSSIGWFISPLPSS